MKFTEAKTVGDLNPKARKRLLGFVFGTFALLLIVCFIPSGESSEKEEKVKIPEYYIEGFEPVTTYMNLKEWGFTVKKDFDVESGNLWTCTREDYGITHTVTIYSPRAANKAQSMRLNIMVDPGYAAISEGKYFAEKIATIIYDSADQSKARRFVQENYNNDQASIVIGDAIFTMYAPSDYVRMLNIDKYIPQ